MRIATFLCFSLVTLFLSGCCTPEPVATLPVAVNAQETSMWCWAASGQMSMGYFGTSVQQCDEANKRFGRTDCCNNPVPGDCVTGGWTEFDKYGFTASNTTDAPLSWGQVQDQIYCQKKPFEFTWHWTSGGGHMMVARGYVSLNGTNYIYRNNPLPVGVGTADIIPYDNYVSGSDHTHWDDYYNITKK
jgi:Papain-like cysteine protease AvrRpt2